MQLQKPPADQNLEQPMTTFWRVTSKNLSTTSDNQLTEQMFWEVVERSATGLLLCVTVAFNELETFMCLKYEVHILKLAKL